MYSEETPNPQALKFILGSPVVESGFHLFTSLKEVEGNTFLEDIFSLPGIVSVLLTPDFITINKSEELSWSLLESVIFSVFQHHLSSFPLSITELTQSHQGGIPKDFSSWKAPNEEIAKLMEDLEAFIEDRIRPAIQEDGGIIHLVAFEDGMVYVTLQGSCSGCPMSHETLKGGIEQNLKHYFPEVKEVSLV